jgi:hypothetical protein
MIAKVAKTSKRGSQPGERRGGRQPGTPNKKTAETIAKAEAGGIMPLEYMLQILRDTTQEPSARFGAAVQAAPYLHPKLSSIEQSTEEKTETTIWHRSLAEALAASKEGKDDGSES